MKYIDSLISTKLINEKFIVQYGYSTYKPNCERKQFMSFDEMMENMNKAHIVITHGGPSSFLQVLSFNKIPIVVPRRKKYDEHVNDHQYEFSNFMNNKYNNLIIANDLEELKTGIFNFDDISAHKAGEISKNNDIFNSKLEKIIKRVMEK
jgi:UDP-N-acetylglucosamine transferase subunit ALG13